MKNRYSEKERLEILEELRKSNLSVIKFARENSIPASTIFTWLKREKESKQVAEKTLNQKNKNTLVEVVVSKKIKNNEKEKYTESKQALVLACNGCALQIADNFNQTTLRKVLEVIKEI